MRELRHTILTLTSLGIVLASTPVTWADGRTEFYQGHVTHGINVFNDEPLVDYSGVSPSVPWLNADPLVKEIGVIGPSGALDADVITAETDRTLPMATIRSFVDFFNPASLTNASWCCLLQTAPPAASTGQMATWQGPRSTSGIRRAACSASSVGTMARHGCP